MWRRSAAVLVRGRGAGREAVRGAWWGQEGSGGVVVGEGRKEGRKGRGEVRITLRSLLQPDTGLSQSLLSFLQDIKCKAECSNLQC